MRLGSLETQRQTWSHTHHDNNRWNYKNFKKDRVQRKCKFWKQVSNKPQYIQSDHERPGDRHHRFVDLNMQNNESLTT